MYPVRATGLSKSYGEVAAVAALDLEIPAGQIVGILGPNGAGKTTTIEMLLGLRRPGAGRVELFGQAPESSAARARVGAMLQDSDGPESLTVAETIGLVRRYYPYALPVAEVLERADLGGKARSKVGQLSGGQRQRLSFALAIVGDPDLLFLDEPTAALDVAARKVFWTQVRGFAELGKTILFSSHNLVETDAVADRVVVINRGQIVMDGTPASIKASVAARTVRLLTDASPDQIRGIDGVGQVWAEPAHPDHLGLSRLVVQTSTPEHLLHELFAADHEVHDLTVVDTDLEAAFVHLTTASGEAAGADTKEAAA